MAHKANARALASLSLVVPQAHVVIRAVEARPPTPGQLQLAMTRARKDLDAVIEGVEDGTVDETDLDLL
jgi:hypothetical protein